MPLALALVLLWGLGGSGGWGCLQCDRSVLGALGHLRSAIFHNNFHVAGMRARARAVLLSMEGPFFADYAKNAFIGKVGVCLGALGGRPGWWWACRSHAASPTVCRLGSTGKCGDILQKPNAAHKG